MILRNYMVAQNLNQTEGASVAPKTATLFLVQQHHSLPPRKTQAEVGGLPADCANAPFLLIYLLGSQRVSRYYYSTGRLPKGPLLVKMNFAWKSQISRFVYQKLGVCCGYHITTIL